MLCVYLFTKWASEACFITLNHLFSVLPSGCGERIVGKSPFWNSAGLPSQHGVTDVLCAQGVALHEFVADAVLEGAVEPRGAAVGVEDLEASQLVVPVHD